MILKELLKCLINPIYNINMKIVKTFNEWLNEEKDEVIYASAILRRDHLDLKKGEDVRVDALEYTEAGDGDDVNIITSDRKKYTVDKGLLDVKI